MKTLVALTLAFASTALAADRPPASLPAFGDTAEWLAYRTSVEAELARARSAISEAARDAKPGERVELSCPGRKTWFTAGKDEVPFIGNGKCQIKTEAGMREVLVPDSMWGVDTGPFGGVIILGGGRGPQRFPQKYNRAAGIETGGLLKQSGDFLLFLRRGRLFSIRATASELKLVSSADVEGLSAREGDWYEEMLVDGNTIIILGFDREREATRIELFDLSSDGHVSHRDSYSRDVDLRSFHLAGNYASRLEGHSLAFYAPVWLDFSDPARSQLPVLRRWNGSEDVDVTPVVPTEIHRSGVTENDVIQSLHLMTRCDLDVTPIRCRTRGVLANHAAFDYAASDAVYLWARTEGFDKENYAILRLPFDGSAPTSLRVGGSPVDSDDAVVVKDGYLNALVTKGSGEAFFRAPIAEFGDRMAESRPEHFRVLPTGEGGINAIAYVNDWLLYSRSSPDQTAVMRVDDHEAPVQLPLAEVGKIEPMGEDALAFGYLKNETRLASINLGVHARVATKLYSKQSGTPDSRTDGSSYQALGDGRGLFVQPLADYNQATGSLQFFLNDHLKLERVGELVSLPKREDGCKVSCDDFGWHGDARAIFIGDRIYGWIGYDLIEARFEGGRIREKRRIDFTPPLPKFEPPACYQGETYRDGPTTAPGTKVVLDSSFNGFHRETTADRNGSYEFSGLQPGTYTLTIGSGLMSVSTFEIKYHGCRQKP